MPLFLLMGGEFVIAFLLARIAVWVLRGRQARALEPPPPGPGISVARLSGAERSFAPRRAEAASRRAEATWRRAA